MENIANLNSFRINFDQHSFRQWLGTEQAPKHYLNQWWLYGSLGPKKIQWNLYQNTNSSLQGNVFENVACKMSILFRPQLAFFFGLQAQYGRKRTWRTNSLTSTKTSDLRPKASSGGLLTSGNKTVAWHSGKSAETKGQISTSVSPGESTGMGMPLTDRAMFWPMRFSRSSAETLISTKMNITLRIHPEVSICYKLHDQWNCKILRKGLILSDQWYPRTWWRHQMETFTRNWPFVRGIPHTKASDTELWCFLWSAPK